MALRYRRIVAPGRPFAGRGCFFLIAVGVLLGACTAAPIAQGIYDPYEVHNRKRFEKAVKFDRAVARPVSQAYGTIVPSPARAIVGNLAGNLSLPSSIVNDLLQAKVDDALSNTARFVFNSTVGLVGMLDPATLIGLHARSSDFGETLHVWGAAEGAYLVAPLVGPSTERDAVGSLVDLFTNPLSYVLPTPERFAVPVSGGLARVDDRFRFANTVDSILYDSADAYTQSRLLYLEKRRFELGGSTQEDYFDPYDDPYSQ